MENTALQVSDLAKVMAKTTLGKSTIYAYVKDGKFPAPIKVGDRAIAWLDSEIDAWLEARIKATRSATQ